MDIIIYSHFPCKIERISVTDSLYCPVIVWGTPDTDRDSWIRIRIYLVQSQWTEDKHLHDDLSDKQQ